MQFLCLLMSLLTADFYESSRTPLPSEIYTVESLVAMDSGEFYVLDLQSFSIAKIGKRENLVKGQQGQGPGEFNTPLSITAANGQVFVGDFFKIHVYDADTLTYLKQIDTQNNCLAMSWFDGELFLSIGPYPSNEYGMQVYRDGLYQRHFYKHSTPNAPDIMKFPFFDQGRDGRLYILHHQQYRIDILNTKGEVAQSINAKQPAQYRPPTDLTRVERKYGINLKSWNHWQTEWSVSSGIAIVDNRYLWVCFEELQKDLLTKRYFIDVYDLSENRKIVSWKEMPGRLYDGSVAAYFVEERKGLDQDNDLEIVGYRVSENNEKDGRAL